MEEAKILVDRNFIRLEEVSERFLRGGWWKRDK